MPPNEYRKTEQSADLSMTIKVDGVAYPFNLSDVTASIELELYQQTGGLRLTQVISEIATAPAGFHVAALVFLARRSRGDQVTFTEVADHMGLASDLEVIMDDEDDTSEAGGHPEVRAAN